MEFFKVPCPGKGNVNLDGVFQGPNFQNGALHVFQCNRGDHDIEMTCLVGKNCKESMQNKVVKDTDPILPMEVPFSCLSE
ncbi:MAG: hypothetical protein KKC20_20595 [Proteobacteria bacterium]|nr:hypothetical protein [Pseudomonadota bacterium]